MTLEHAIEYCEKEAEKYMEYGIETECYQCAMEYKSIAEFLIELKERRAADAQPIHRGRWIDIYEYCKMNGYKPSGVAVYYWCSECMKEQEKTSDFCPCCGADMRGDVKEEK